MTPRSIAPGLRRERIVRGCVLLGIMLAACLIPAMTWAASPTDLPSPTAASACDAAQAPDGLCMTVLVRHSLPRAVGRTRPGAIRATFQAPAPESDNTLPVVYEGEYLEVRLRSRDSGWITLWDHDAEGAVVVLLPNRRSQPTKQGGNGVSVQAGQVLCVGSDADRDKIELFPRFGPSRSHLHWTSDDADQLRPEMLGASRSARQIVAEPLDDDGAGDVSGASPSSVRLTGPMK
jgi:hypothetical protein